jgi:hypothetical protein
MLVLTCYLSFLTVTFVFFANGTLVIRIEPP